VPEEELPCRLCAWCWSRGPPRRAAELLVRGRVAAGDGDRRVVWPPWAAVDSRPQRPGWS